MGCILSQTQYAIHRAQNTFSCQLLIVQATEVAFLLLCHKKIENSVPGKQVRTKQEIIEVFPLLPNWNYYTFGEIVKKFQCNNGIIPPVAATVTCQWPWQRQQLPLIKCLHLLANRDNSFKVRAALSFPV